MAAEALTRIYRRDYSPPNFAIETVDLTFVLDPEETLVRARLAMTRTSETTDLALDGEELTLRSVKLDGDEVPADRFEATPDRLLVRNVPDRFTLETEVVVHPRANTKLMGLYQSNGNYCTQCEAEGFRRMTYFLDRPDVMARYTTRIEADRDACPVLLSNGNRIEAGELPGGRHFVEWRDPFPKPS
ncbi:MAG: aminopeptidase N, partial [Myxococcota bacterium]